MIKNEFECPFCGQLDFDLYGLQMHLQIHCDVFGYVTDKNQDRFVEKRTLDSDKIKIGPEDV